MFSTNLIPVPAGRTIRDCITVMTGASARTWTLALSTAFAVFVRASESSAAPLDYCYSSQTVSPGAAGARPISDALAKACSNGTINVNPGTYTETLGITKNVTIKAVNPGLAPVIKNLVVQPAPLALVTVSGAATVTLANLKLTPVAIRGLYGVKTAAGAPSVTVTGLKVSGGTTGVDGTYHKLSASGSSFAAASGDCLRAYSGGLDGSSVNITGSSAGTCGGNGIKTSGFKSASYTYNTVTWAGSAGLASSSNFWVAIAHNTVESSYNGVSVVEAGFGSVESNDAAFSTFADYYVAGSEDLIVADNHSKYAKHIGFMVAGDSSGISLESNDVTWPKGPGIYIDDSAGITMAYNLVHGGLPGVYVRDSLNISMDGDVVTGGKRAGIELHEVAEFSADFVDIAGIKVDPDGAYGDGVIVDHTGSGPAVFTNCHIENVARAGVAGFDTAYWEPIDTVIELVATNLTCAPMSLMQGQTISPSGVEFVNGGGTLCFDCNDAPIDCYLATIESGPPKAIQPLLPAD